jgi:hypothetical protein
MLVVAPTGSERGFGTKKSKMRNRGGFSLVTLCVQRIATSEMLIVYCKEIGARGFFPARSLDNTPIIVFFFK